MYYLVSNSKFRIPLTAALVLFAQSLLICQTDANLPMKGITVYVSYPDAPPLVEQAQLDSILNAMEYSEPGIRRTFRKYWHQQSRRNIDITHDIFFYEAPELFTYYENLNWQEVILTWKDALETIISQNPDYDWDLLSQNSNGALSSVMFISSKWGAPAWGGAHYPRWTLSNGKVINQIYGSVLRAPWDNQHNLFMTLHEGGHGIFLFPDTYDTEYNSSGTSFYTLMSGGKPDIEPLGAPFLAERNWGHIVELSSGQHRLTLRADGDSIFVFRNLHDPSEFYSIEARSNKNIGNSLFPASIGLLVWHSDNKVHTSNREEGRGPIAHYRHSIVQADGKYELEGPLGANGDVGDLYLPGKELNTNSNPPSNWWNGESSGFELLNIEIVDDEHISFDVVIPKLHDDHYPALDKDNWLIIDAYDGQTGHEIEKAIDSDSLTYYHLPWANNLPRPHEVTIYLGDEFTVNEFYIQANNNWSPPWEGRIQYYRLYISDDLDEWGDPVAEGELFRTEYKQHIPIEPKSGLYAKFSAIASYDNDSRTSIAEIDLHGFLTSILPVDDVFDHNDIRVFPNPFYDNINVDTRSSKASLYKIYSLSGQIVKSGTIMGVSSLDLNSLENGLYILEISNQYGRQVRKIYKN